ncbi:MAG: hypothetical protein Q4F72_10065, partial [Desulfovibrionaceae bacterium]|nr:hypothetical protein [Desulfovibrionaceae bacterium]
MLDIEKINSRFRKAGERIVGHRLAILVAFVLILAFSAASLPHLKSDTNQESYFLENDDLLVAKKYFESIFGNDDFCAVLVETDDVFRPRTLELIRGLSRALKAEVPYADDVVSLTEMEFTEGTAEGMHVGKLVPDPVPSDRAELEAIRKKALDKPSMLNRMVSDDSRQTWVMLRLKPLPQHLVMENGDSVDVAVGKKVNEIAARPEYAELSPRTTGLPVINLEKRLYMAQETPKLLGVSLLLMVGTLAFFLRNVRGIVFPLASAVCGILMVFGLQGWLGIEHDPAMIFLPLFLGMAMAI